MYEGGVKLEEKQLGNVEVLRATSKNVIKRLKLRITTKAKKFVGAVIKKFAIQEFQVKKDKMQKWKKNVI